MNEILIDIFLSDSQNWRFLKDEPDNTRYLYLGDSLEIFEHIFYPYIESLSEKQQLGQLVERLSAGQREALLNIPEQLLQLVTIETISIDDSEEVNSKVLELKCFVRIAKSYKHQAFFELLRFISVDKTFSLDKENHGFGYHFHLYEKKDRTATLLTFDKDEKPCKKGDTDYDIFNHTLYYEPHSEGSTKKGFQDINSKNSSFKSNVYTICKNVVVHKTNKIDFKKQSSTKSIKVSLL